MTNENHRDRTFRSALDELLKAKDEVRLELHLMSKEARRIWQDLEKRAEAIEDEVAGRGGKAAENAAKVEDLARSVRGFVERHVLRTPGRARTVAEVMTAGARTCSSEDRLSQVAQVLWETDAGIVPVVDASGRVVGTVTDRDVCMAAYTQGVPLSESVVARSMSRDVVTCSPEDSLERAAELMSQRRVRRLPVVDAGGKLVGILSLADLARQAEAEGSPALRSLVARTLAAICEPRVGRTGASAAAE